MVTVSAHRVVRGPGGGPSGSDHDEGDGRQLQHRGFFTLAPVARMMFFISFRAISRILQIGLLLLRSDLIASWRDLPFGARVDQRRLADVPQDHRLWCLVSTTDDGHTATQRVQVMNHRKRRPSLIGNIEGVLLMWWRVCNDGPDQEVSAPASGWPSGRTRRGRRACHRAVECGDAGARGVALSDGGRRCFRCVMRPHRRPGRRPGPRAVASVAGASTRWLRNPESHGSRNGPARAGHGMSPRNIRRYGNGGDGLLPAGSLASGHRWRGSSG